jgi:hypothetical protein
MLRRFLTLTLAALVWTPGSAGPLVTHPHLALHVAADYATTRDEARERTNALRAFLRSAWRVEADLDVDASDARPNAPLCDRADQTAAAILRLHLQYDGPQGVELFGRLGFSSCSGPLERSFAFESQQSGRIEAVNDLEGTVLEQLVAELRRASARDPAHVRNLAAAGIDLDDRRSSILAALAWSGGSAPRFESVDPRGTAAHAGIRNGDRLLTLNGVSTTFLDADTLAHFVIVADRTGWTARFAGAAGVRTRRFAAEDARWYLRRSGR